MVVKYFTNGDINVINTGDNDLSKNFGPTYGNGYNCKKSKGSNHHAMQIRYV